MDLVKSFLVKSKKGAPREEEYETDSDEFESSSDEDEDEDVMME